MHRRSILIISDFVFPLRGGVEYHINTLSKSIMENYNIAINILTRSTGNLREDKQRVREAANRNIHVAFLPLATLGPTTLPTIGPHIVILHRLIKERGIELVHCHQSYSVMALFMTLQAKLLGLPVVFTDHSSGRGDFLSEVLLGPFRQICLAAADNIITVSHEAGMNLIRGRFANINPHKLTIIPNPVDVPDISRYEASVEKNLLKFDEDTIVITTVMRLTARKGVHLLINLVKQLIVEIRQHTTLRECLVRQLHYNASMRETYGKMYDILDTYESSIIKTPQKVAIIVVGNGPGRLLVQQLQHEITECETAHSIHLTYVCHLSNAKVHYALEHSDIALIPSSTESFSIFLAEAVIHRNLVICTKCGGVESLYKGISGVLAGALLCEVDAAVMLSKLFACMLVRSICSRGGLKKNEDLKLAEKNCRAYTDPHKVASATRDVYYRIFKAKSLNVRRRFLSSMVFMETSIPFIKWLLFVGMLIDLLIVVLDCVTCRVKKWIMLLHSSKRYYHTV